jgi:hypothetical protein
MGVNGMASAYYNNLIRCVLDASRSDYWETAVYEWEIVDYEEDESCESACICGKQGIRYLYTIRNNIVYDEEKNFDKKNSDGREISARGTN